MILIFTLIILLFSAVIHEVMHGAVADRLGDPTARLAGRLTFNPLKHLDPVGSVLLPLLMALLPGGVIFGWARPVPYNPYNLKRPERDGAIIALAGPLSNLGIAIVFSLLIQIAVLFLPSNSDFPAVVMQLSVQTILVNVTLAVFNLVPLPPLDGSKILFAFLKQDSEIRLFLERYGTIALFIFIFWGFGLISPIIFRIFHFLTLS